MTKNDNRVESPQVTTDEPASEQRIYRGRTSQQRADERRQRLIAAALQLYGESGFRTTTVKAICREAGLTERYFYESFTNSEELLCAVCSWSMERIRHLFRSAVARAGDAPPEQLAATAQAYFDYVQSNPGHARIVLFEMEGASRTSGEYLRRELDQTIALIVELHFAPLGPPPAGLDPNLLARALLGAGFQLAKEWTLSDFQLPSTCLTRQLSAIYAGVIRFWKDPEPS